MAPAAPPRVPRIVVRGTGRRAEGPVISKAPLGRVPLPPLVSVRGGESKGRRRRAAPHQRWAVHSRQGEAEAREGPTVHSRGPSPSRRSGSESRSPVGDRAPPKLSGASGQLYARAPAWFGPNCNSSWADQVGARSPRAAEWGNGVTTHSSRSGPEATRTCDPSRVVGVIWGGR